MKRTMMAVVPIAVGIVLFGTGVKGQTTNNPATKKDPAWIQQLFDDSHSSIKLTPEEETEHAQRIRRLSDLQKERSGESQSGVISESAGAAPPAFHAPEEVPEVRPQAPATAPPARGSETGERLIEAVEALQMEIRQLRSDIAHDRREATRQQAPEPGGIEGPSTQDVTPETFNNNQ